MYKGRELYKDLLIKNLKRGRIFWAFNEGVKYFRILGSSLFSKAICGPIVGSILITYRCNANCIMCDLPERVKDNKELSTDEFKNVIDSFEKLGVNSIGFTGGEPLLRDDIFGLIEYAHRKNLFTQLSTNGFLLNDNMVKSLIESGLDSINISLDSASSEIHDKIRGIKRGFQKAINGIKQLAKFRKERKRDLLITISAIISEYNLSNYIDILNMVPKIGADYLVVETLEGIDPPLPLSRMQELDKLVNRLVALKNDGGCIENSIYFLKMLKQLYRRNRNWNRCYATYSFCMVDAYGDVFPCWGWLEGNKPIDNVKIKPLEKIWYSTKYAKVRRNLKNCNKCSYHCHVETNLLYRWFYG